LRTRAIPERLRRVITTRRYTNPRLLLPYLTHRLLVLSIPITWPDTLLIGYLVWTTYRPR